MSRSVYVVRRLSFDANPDIEGCVRVCGDESDVAGVPVRAFADRSHAEAFCTQQEAIARAAVPPGRVCGWDYRNGLQDDPGQLIMGIRRLGLTPFASDGYSPYSDGLLRWWAAVAADATPEQRAGVWDLLGVRFYDVVETTLS